MTAASTPLDSDTAPDSGAWARPRYGRHIAMLDDLVEEGRGITRGLARRFEATDADESLAGDVALARLERLARAHARASRALRLTIMLQARLIKELEAWDRKAAEIARMAAVGQQFETSRRADQRRAQIEAIVERVAQGAHEGEPDGPYEVECLVSQASERLDRSDVHGGLLSRPVSEWVDLICRELGLDPDWPRLSQEAWAREEQAENVDAGWPLRSAARDAPTQHEGHKGGFAASTKDTKIPLVSFVPPS